MASGGSIQSDFRGRFTKGGRSPMNHAGRTSNHEYVLEGERSSKIRPEVEHMFIMWKQFMQFFREQGQVGGSKDNGKKSAEHKALERFLKFHNPKFLGEPDDRKAEAWIRKMEKIFQVLNSSDGQRIQYATFLMEDVASHWWRLINISGSWTEPLGLGITFYTSLLTNIFLRL